MKKIKKIRGHVGPLHKIQGYQGHQNISKRRPHHSGDICTTRGNNLKTIFSFMGQNVNTRYKCCAQHNGRVANYCHVPLVIRRVHITSTPQAIHLLALCGEVIDIHLRTKKNRSRSSIFELEIHPWYKFGINATNID